MTETLQAVFYKLSLGDVMEIEPFLQGTLKEDRMAARVADLHESNGKRFITLDCYIRNILIKKVNVTVYPDRVEFA